jgi:hypothetical protein
VESSLKRFSGESAVGFAGAVSWRQLTAKSEIEDATQRWHQKSLSSPEDFLQVRCHQRIFTFLAEVPLEFLSREPLPSPSHPRLKTRWPGLL